MIIILPRKVQKLVWSFPPEPGCSHTCFPQRRSAGLALTWVLVSMVAGYACSGDSARSVSDSDPGPQDDSIGDIARADLITGDLRTEDSPDAGFADLEHSDLDADLKPNYPMDNKIRLNEIQLKGTHNSYHLITEETGYDEWLYEHKPLDVQLDKFGIRQVELDVHWDDTIKGFTVFHIPVMDEKSTCHTFVECLTLLRNWSLGNSGHGPLFILVEPKDDIDMVKITGHFDELDAEILSVWPRESIFAPADLLGDAATTEEAVLQHGWPTLDKVRNKAVFLMLDEGAHALEYRGEDDNLTQRPMFVRGKEGQPWAAFIEVGNPLSQKDQISDLVTKGYIMRITAYSTDPDKLADNPAKAEAALASGAQIISSDFTYGEGDYTFDIPGGRPYRCNPVVVSNGCLPEYIENLDQAGGGN